MNSNRTVVWAGSDPTVSHAVVESAVRQFDLAARFCPHSELVKVLAGEQCSLVVVEFGPDVRAGLELLKDVMKRSPRLVALVASSDVSLPVLRAAIEAGAADILSLPLNPQELNKALVKVHQVAARAAGAQAP